VHTPAKLADRYARASWNSFWEPVTISTGGVTLRRAAPRHRFAGTQPQLQPLMTSWRLPINLTESSRRVHMTVSTHPAPAHIRTFAVKISCTWSVTQFAVLIHLIRAFAAFQSYCVSRHYFQSPVRNTEFCSFTERNGFDSIIPASYSQELIFKSVYSGRGMGMAFSV
jgi:hypothetical protein